MKRYIISSIVPGATPNKAFIQALETYKKNNKNTEILLGPSQKVYKDDEIDPYFTKFKIISKDIKLNANIHISLMPINVEAIDPVMGLGRQTHTDGSAIFFSPKVRLKSVPSPNNGMSRRIMTPGAVTNPYYKTSKRGLMAKKDHVSGAVIVEVVDNQTYHFRHVKSLSDGSFIDLGVRYYPNGYFETVKLLALIPGDWHVGYTDPLVRKATVEMIKDLKPTMCIFHDFSDCISISPHVSTKLITKATLQEMSKLETELKMGAEELDYFAGLVDRVIVVKSNHDIFLDRWLDEGRYLHDSQNYIIGLELALAKAHGKDPLEAGYKKFGKLHKVKFLKEDESFKISAKNIECGVHGHRGPNGSRGSIVGLESAYQNLVFGHTHNPEILRDAYNVGTSTYLKLGYNVGPTSWGQTHCAVYADGTRQLINIIDGKWKA